MLMILKRLALAALILAGLAVPAVAQWQVPTHAIPLGKGSGQGFASIAAAANTKFLVGGGTSSDPIMQIMSGDCTLVAGAVTCTKTNGTSFAAVATSGSASDLGSGLLPNARLDAEVQCIAGLTSAADKVAYFTGSGTCALADFPSAFRTFLTTASSANLRAVLSDETGNGLDYFQNGDLGTPSAGVGTNLTGIPLTSGVTGILPVANGGTNGGTVRDAALGLNSGYVLAQSAVAQSVTGTTSETVLATVTIPANAIGANGQIVIETAWTVTNSANNKTMRVRFGASGAGTGGTLYANSNVTAANSNHDYREIANRNATNSQVGFASTLGTGGGFASAAAALVTSAIDTTAASEVAITGVLANSGETITLEAYRVTVYPKS